MPKSIYKITKYTPEEKIPVLETEDEDDMRDMVDELLNEMEEGDINGYSVFIRRGR